MHHTAKSIIVPILAGCALFATACSVQRDYEGAYGAYEEGTFTPNSDMYSVTSGDLDLRDGFLAGTIGPMNNLNDDAAELNGWQETNWATLEVIVRNDRGAAMSWFDVNGGFFHPGLRPGSTYTFSANDYPSDPQNELYISGVGCAGNGSIGDWSYDEPIDEVTVDIEETADPDVNRMNFTSRIGSSVSTGHVDVALAD
jgi:hypothetical protein